MDEYLGMTANRLSRIASDLDAENAFCDVDADTKEGAWGRCNSFNEEVDE